MKIVWSRRAIAHLRNLRDYIARDSPDSAADVAQRILAAVANLGTYPNLGRAGRISGTRELVIPGTPYVIPYRIRGSRVELIAVFHGRQRWPD
jgi:addiction module RelE/StbE family toxin